MSIEMYCPALHMEIMQLVSHRQIKCPCDRGFQTRRHYYIYKSRTIFFVEFPFSIRIKTQINTYVYSFE